MNAKNPRIWLGLLSALVVLYLVGTAAFTRRSPGALATVHARIEGLQEGCAKCHGGWFGELAESCLACHEAVAAHIESGRGLHGKLQRDLVMGCVRCHSEHNGGGFALVNDRSFALAGVANAREFDHETVGFTMQGRHLELACTKCHEHAETAVLPEGAHRFLGLAQSCTTCHDDPHRGRMVKDCTECHSQQKFEQLDAPNHDRHLPLVGHHGGLSCRECHGKGTAHDLEVVGATNHTVKRTCKDCHESPHEDSFAGNRCASCHDSQHPSFAEPRPLSNEEHAATGFALVAPHDKAECSACHAERGSFRDRHPGRDADSCVSCHEDAHGGQFATSPIASGGCIACHERTHFIPHGFSLDRHAETRFALTGSHAKLDCAKCHEQPKGHPRRFHGTPRTCDACHADAHRGKFDRLERPSPDAGSCARCHQPTTFADFDADRFKHGRDTRFALDGAHAKLTCESCHARSKERDDRGRAFGFAVAHGEKLRGCATCHEDPHDGKLRASCSSCHSTTSFRAAGESFEHGKWTGFELTGAHAKTDCDSCHPRLHKPTPEGRSYARARGNACADCHADPHAGQFERDARTDCRRCHRSTTRFSELSFRHDLDSRFRLGDAHKKLACSACHKPFRHEGRDVTRYRPLGRKCSDCHAAQVSPFRRRSRRRRR